jgi:membrane-bound lytic murein transglycosylase D
MRDRYRQLPRNQWALLVVTLALVNLGSPTARAQDPTPAAPAPLAPAPPALPAATPPPVAGTCNTPFSVPENLRPGIAFWKDVFLHHGSDRVVLHDRENLSVVWQVVELPRGEDGQILEAQVDTLAHKTADGLRQRLRALEERAFVPDDEDDRILLTLVGGDTSMLAGAWQRVRIQRGVADHFKQGLAVAQNYLPQIREVLAEEEVPNEIAALPFVESMFNPQARSAAGAAGVWQLMPATARGLGLKVTARVDERLDISKATRAAVRMLRKNFLRLGSWPLAITAYNHGPNGVSRAILQAGSTDLGYLIDNYRKSTWGFASKNFYAEFLAAAEVLAAQPGAWAPLVSNAITDSQPALR